MGKGRHDKMIAPDEVKGLIASEVEEILGPVAKPFVPDAGQKPFVVLMVGVNGSGKTTTIGKLAAQWRGEGKRLTLAAGDTFRAAAIEQLKVWGARTGPMWWPANRARMPPASPMTPSRRPAPTARTS